MQIWDKLEAMDKSFTLLINSYHTPFSDVFWTAVSGKLTWIPLYVLILILLVKRFGWKKTLIFLGITALTILICDQFANLVKHFFQRLRPCSDPWMIENGLHMPITPSSSFSFFSAHAANNFALASLLGYTLKKHDSKKHPDYFIMYVWATLIAFSRIFVARHFFGDIFVGALVGIALGYLMGLVYSIVLVQFQKRNWLA